MIKIAAEIYKITNFFLAKIIYTLLNKPQKKIWLIGGHGGRDFGDNSAALFRFIRSDFPKINIYWVVNRNCPKLDEIKKYGLVLKKNSLKSNLFSLYSEVQIYSHNFNDISNYNPITNKGPLRVFLGHGFEGLKKPNSDNRANSYHKGYFDLAIANSSLDTKIKRDVLEIAEQNIHKLGSPNLDCFYKINEKPQKEILYFPTWRDWESPKDKEPFFIEQLQKFCSDKNLSVLLEKYNLKLKIILHINFYRNKRFLSLHKKINTDLIKILPPKTNISNEIINSKFLITDYSGVAFLFLYIKKPVIFFQPDQNRYLKERGSYLDFESDLFGEVCLTSNECVKKMEQLLKGNRLQSQKEVKARKKYFYCFDNNNSKRVTKKILEIIHSKYI